MSMPEPRNDALVPFSTNAAVNPRDPAYLPGYGESEPSGGGVHWGRYIDSIRRHKWLILLITVAGTALGFFVTQFLTPKYIAQSTVWIGEGGRGSGGSGPIRAPQLLNSYAWIELVNSYAVLEPVVREMALNVVPADEDAAEAMRDVRLADGFHRPEPR